MKQQMYKRLASARAVFILGLFQFSVLAQSQISLSIDANSRGTAIPDEFIGLSFEASNLLPDKNGQHLFSATNKPLINLFRNIGIKNLRVGGGTVDMTRYAVPSTEDIDNLFAFAKVADLKVIYSFRLLNGSKTNAAAVAGYIWHNYRQHLDSFSIGNEPDWKAYHNKDPKITNYPSFLADWRDFAAAIHGVVPDAQFSGPDTGSNFPAPGATNTCFNGKTWTELFADDEKHSGIVSTILQHDYVGQNAKGVSVPDAVDAMLSRDRVNVNYPALYDHVLARVATDGFAYRMTECNDYVGGVKDASNAFVSALWALDYMHWWAAHGCSGVNFHNRKWIFTDTIYQDADGNFWINPKAYALKAFDLGSHGNIMTSVQLSNPAHINVTCYAAGNSTNLYVTIINKTYASAGETNVVVTIQPKHFAVANAGYMALESATPGDYLAMEARPLGGSPIDTVETWHGDWTPLDITAAGETSLSIGPASAVVVHLTQ